jgi:hypothetical protein
MRIPGAVGVDVSAVTESFLSGGRSPLHLLPGYFAI